MPGALTWQSDERCVVGDITFQILPVDLLNRDHPSISMADADFLLLKHRPLVDRYVEVLEELRPRHIFELGILEGGSTVLLLELAQPHVLVAIDQKPSIPALEDHISLRELDQVVRIHRNVDQADRRRLGEIADEAFGDQPLDLVVDDCSHLYEATKASFNELFPRLRPGGLYMIEDWDWARVREPGGARNAYEEKLADVWADQIPLTRLIHELVVAVASAPGLISEITIEDDLAQVRRGNAHVEPPDFDISKCSDLRRHLPRARRGRQWRNLLRHG
jgi:predicted O-methyltransferase YrrM